MNIRLYVAYAFIYCFTDSYKSASKNRIKTLFFPSGIVTHATFSGYIYIYIQIENKG